MTREIIRSLEEREREVEISNGNGKACTLHCCVCCRCLGSTQHLKDRHGSGYVLEVKLAPPSLQAQATSNQQAQATSNQQQASQELSYQQQDDDQQLGRFCEEVERTFDGAQVLEPFGDRVTFRIAQHSVGSLSRVFAWFEEGTCFYCFTGSLSWS